MKRISFSEFKNLKVGDIKDGPCMEVTADGEHLFIAIVGSEADMRVSMVGQASQIDAARGKT